MVSEIRPSARLTHLVVPRFHRKESLVQSTELRRWIDARLALGDEVAAHGYYHLDDGPAPRSIGAWIARRVLTQGEGEFATLNARLTQQRVVQCLHEMEQCGWQVSGFVPPAWQINAAARTALCDLPMNRSLSYTSTTNYLWRLPDDIAYRVPCLGFSARSAWRRWLSIRYNNFRVHQLRDEPFLRIALHPIDAMYANTLEAWRELIAAVLHDRIPVTKATLLTYVEQGARQRSLLKV